MADVSTQTSQILKLHEKSALGHIVEYLPLFHTYVILSSTVSILIVPDNGSVSLLAIIDRHRVSFSCSPNRLHTTLCHSNETSRTKDLQKLISGGLESRVMYVFDWFSAGGKLLTSCLLCRAVAPHGPFSIL